MQFTITKGCGYYYLTASGKYPADRSKRKAIDAILYTKYPYNTIRTYDTKEDAEKAIEQLNAIIAQ